MKPVFKMVCFILPCFLFALNVSAASSLRIYTVQDEINEPNLRYTCAYARVLGIRDAEAQNRINVRLHETAESARLAAQLAAKELSSRSAVVNGSFGFSVPRNEKGFVSIVMKQSCRVDNARGMTRQTAMTFDTVNGRELRLGDLFRDDVNHQAILDEAVRDGIKRRNLSTRLTQPFKTVGETRQFYLTSDSLVLFFQPYELLPYEDGVVEFSIPLHSMDGCLKPAFLF